MKKKMSKWIAAGLVLILALTAAGCGKTKAEEPAPEAAEAAEETAEETAEEAAEENKEEIVGGWEEAQDGAITEDLQALFDKAMEGMTGVDYVPVKLLATQVVAGTNYKFLCEGTTVVPDGETKMYIVTIYEDLQGGVSVLEIEETSESA